MSKAKALLFGAAPAVLSLFIRHALSSLSLDPILLRVLVIVLSASVPMLLFKRCSESPDRPRLAARFSPHPFFLCLAGLILSDIFFGLFASPSADVPISVSDLICSVLLAPIFEELLYRRLILSALLPLSRITAVLLSAFLFGAAHSSPLAILHACLCGIFLAWLTLKTNTVLPAILAHAIYNLLSLLSSYGAGYAELSTAAALLLLVSAAGSMLVRFILLICGRISAKNEKKG